MTAAAPFRPGRVAIHMAATSVLRTMDRPRRRYGRTIFWWSAVTVGLLGSIPGAAFLVLRFTAYR